MPPPSMKPTGLVALREARSLARSESRLAGGLERHASSGAGGAEQEDNGYNPLLLFVGGFLLLGFAGITYEGFFSCMAKDAKMDTPDRYIPACFQLSSGVLVAELVLNAVLFFNPMPAPTASQTGL